MGGWSYGKKKVMQALLDGTGLVFGAQYFRHTKCDPFVYTNSLPSVRFTYCQSGLVFSKNKKKWLCMKICDILERIMQIFALFNTNFRASDLNPFRIAAMCWKAVTLFTGLFFSGWTNEKWEFLPWQCAWGTGTVCQVRVSSAFSQATSACFPLLLTFFFRVECESKAGKRLGEKPLVPGCSRAPLHLPLSACGAEEHLPFFPPPSCVVCWAYKAGVSKDPKTLFLPLSSCWVLLCLLWPAVDLKWDVWKAGADVMPASATSSIL